MWVILIKKIPCEVSPPKMSIFWSTPWPHQEFADSQKEKNEEGELELLSPDMKLSFPEDAIFGVEPNWNGARQILFDNKQVRIFPHEFNPVPSDRLRAYIDEGVYELVPEGVASEQVIQDLMEGDKKVLWEHALVDGCTDSQARMVALGIDVSIPDAEIPPVGWWKCRPEYAEVFCTESEMMETRTHMPPMPVARPRILGSGPKQGEDKCPRKSLVTRRKTQKPRKHSRSLIRPSMPVTNSKRRT